MAAAPPSMAAEPNPTCPGPLLLVGLGNPGDRYAGTRHNVGFDCVERVQSALEEVRSLPLSGGDLAEGFVASSDGEEDSAPQERVLLLRPLLYMNRSGGPTAEVARQFEISPSRILVVYDDLDLPLGRLRIRRKGTSGGHNGVSDLIDRLAQLQEERERDEEPFPRIRLGIGKPTEGGIESHVLGRFTVAEQPIAEAMVARAAEAAIHWFRHGIARTMNEFNQGASAPPAVEPEE